MVFKKAEKSKSKLRLAIQGASGSGKTYSALILAESIGKKIAVVDTENGSASLYADKFNFDVLELLPPYEPERYIKALKEAESLGYEVIVLDSISHEWNGAGGALDLVTQVGGNSYTAWGKITPRHDKFIGAILQSKCHVIATLRSKVNYELGKDDRGKMTIEKKGTAPIQRDSVDYEFTIVFDLNQRHSASASKDRTGGLFDGKDFIITKETGEILLNWLNSGVEKKIEIVKEELEFDHEKNVQMLRDALAGKDVDMVKFLAHYKAPHLPGFPDNMVADALEKLATCKDKPTAAPKTQEVEMPVAKRVYKIRKAGK